MRAKATQKPKILVVDDEPDNLDLLYRSFRREYKVLRAESGLKALDILGEESDIAVIISDQRMPGMSGTEFLSLTAVQYPDVIRIILTGYTDVEDLVKAINSGKVFKYVTKPWDADALKELVRQALETHNVLKIRTEELSRSLRRESLLNTVTNTIRNAQFSQADQSPLQEVLQTIVNTVGQMLEVDLCLLRRFEGGHLVEDEWFAYHTLRDLPPPEVLKQTIWETETIEIINNIETEERFAEPEWKQRLESAQSAKIRSTLVVPLLFQQDLVAVMALHYCREPRTWEGDEIQLAVMVADQAALAISQARAYEQVQALAKRESLVNTITNAIRSSLDPQEIFAAITQQLGQALDVDGCALSLWTKEDEFVHCVGLYDGQSTEVISQVALEQEGKKGTLPAPESQESNLQHLPQSSVPIAGNPVLQQLLNTQQPIVLQDMEECQEMQGFDLPFRLPTRALLVVPLLVDREIIGSISLRQIYRPRQWQERDVELAQAVASQAAIAVQQSRLFQKTRQQAERLLELDRQKTEFFQNISHEFRTPLTLMIGPLDTAVSQNQPLSVEQGAIALRNSRRLLRLVNQLLDLQRLDAGKMQSSFRPCNFADFIEQIVAAFRPYCEKKGLRLETHLASCPTLYLDLEKFDKVLYNLLSNAMKFTPSGGMITVKVETAGDHVQIQVRDTGIGIAPSQIPHLFDRFRQAEGSVNRSYEGSGLGLALVKELVEMHGGQITVSSVQAHSTSDPEAQSGTTFTVWLQRGTAHLPAEMVLEVATEIQANRAAVELADLEPELQEETFSKDTETTIKLEQDAQPQILVVDDNADVRTYISSILRKKGYRLCSARNGEEGYQVALARYPRLIISDLMMPKVSGLDMIAKIRQHKELQGTPVILLTAKADEASRIEGAEMGADAYLSKPFNDRELLAEVRNLLALKANEDKVKQLNHYLTESVLKRFLPPGMVEKAAQGEMTLHLDPEPRLVTILFSDIVGFTRLAGKLRSRRVAQLLNEYLEAMTQAIFENGGTVDKFMGDAIVALFGAPEELSAAEQVHRSVASARAMYRYLDDLNQRWREQGFIGHSGISPVQFRCGIHQGNAVVGMFGSSYRSDYTAIGPPVNIAARLQEATTPNTILVSARVANYLDPLDLIHSHSLQLKGIEEPVQTYEIHHRRFNY
jgi:signal transduction histidine kinase/class 3 adenylate cyclase/ActR/RegA family two-component response regulator